MSVEPRFVGKYEILRAMATGGMAEIYVARAHGIEGFQKPVVLKRLRREIASDPQFVQMFLDEARVLATLQHSNIVQIYDVGEIDGSYFFAMELLRGQDVLHIMSRARKAGSTLPLEHALFIAMSMLAGLHYAHEKRGADGSPLQIVHRDVSPSNVFVTYEGDVKVIDFGIAKTAVQSTHTRFGVVKGKIRYMSPEQCAGGAGGVIDRRSDIFATAIMLWEMTVGKRLFSGADFQMLRQIIETDAPRPSSLVADYPPELERIVMKGLERDPERRYQTAEAMQEDLDAYARACRLAASSLSLARYMREQFSDTIAAWAEADRNDQAFASNIRDLFKSRALDSSTTPSGAVEPPASEGLAPVPITVPRTLPAAEAPKRGRKAPLVVAGIVALLAAAGAFMALRSTSEPSARAETPPSPSGVAAHPSSEPTPMLSTTAATTSAAAAAVSVAPSAAPSAPLPAVPSAPPAKAPAKPKVAAPPSHAPAAPAPAASTPAKRPAWDPDSPLLPP